MTIYILDTNICIYIIKRKPVRVFDRFKELPLGAVGISSVTIDVCIKLLVSLDRQAVEYSAANDTQRAKGALNEPQGTLIANAVSTQHAEGVLNVTRCAWHSTCRRRTQHAKRLYSNR